jgi:hypothetical protein
MCPNFTISSHTYGFFIKVGPFIMKIKLQTQKITYLSGAFAKAHKNETTKNKFNLIFNGLKYAFRMLFELFSEGAKN